MITMKKKKLNENRIKTQIRRIILEGEMENAEAALAAKDLVDRLQDIVVELGKMSNDELPHLVDAIRSSFGTDAATQYQQSAASIIDGFLGVAKEQKNALENATLVLTGDATDSSMSNLGLPNEEGDAAEALPAESGEEPEEKEAEEANPLGRQTRIPTEAKIIALHRALSETDKRKNPLKARRLAEEIRRVATQAIKEEAKAKAKSKGKKPEWLMKAELKAEEKGGKSDKKKVEKKTTKK